MKMTWMMTVDFRALGEMESLLSGGFLLPLLLIQQRIKSIEPRRVKDWCLVQTCLPLPSPSAALFLWWP